MRRLWTRLPALALAALAAGCDDVATVTRAWPGGEAVRQAVVAGRAGGFPVEIHGGPLPRMGADEAAALIRPPGRWPTGLSFRAVAPGPRGARPSDRLVLHFNPLSLRGAGLCDYERLQPVAPPGEDGFTLEAALCRDDRRLASAQVASTASDRETYAEAMTILLRALDDAPR
jgi:hypothetical protein